MMQQGTKLLPQIGVLLWVEMLLSGVLCSKVCEGIELKLEWQNLTQGW
jgi:hypothetical protein